MQQHFLPLLRTCSRGFNTNARLKAATGTAASRFPTTRVEENLLTSFRKKLAIGDTETAEVELKHILASQQPPALSARDFRDVSLMLQKQNLASPSPSLTELTVLLAVHGYCEPLESILVASLKRSSFGDILVLWNRLTKQISDTHYTSPHIHAKVTKSLEKVFYISLAARALLSHESAGVSSGLGQWASIPLNVLKLERFLSPLLPDANLDTARQFAKRIRIARILDSPSNGMPFFASLFERADIDAALHHVEGVMKGVQEGWILISDALVTPDMPPVIAMSERNWGIIIGGFIRCGRIDIARHIWNEMTRLQIPRTAITWNALIDGFHKRGHYDDLFRSWHAMTQSGVTPDISSYTTVISALFQTKRSDEALELWDTLRSRASAIAKETVTATTPTDQSERHHSNFTQLPIVTYNAVIHGLLISARVDDAVALFADMKANGPAPDVTTLNTFIRHHSRKGEMDAIANLLRQLPQTDIRPDVITFTSVLHACLRSGAPPTEAVKRVEAAMDTSGIAPNVVTYSAIIDQCVRQGGQENINTGFEWLWAMQRRGLSPNEVTFTALLAALQRDQSLPRSFVQEKMQVIHQMMGAKGARKNRVTYNILIKASLSNPSFEGLHAAIGYYHQMVQEGIKANPDTWYLLLHGAVTRRAFDEGKRLLIEMENAGFEPQGRLKKLTERLQQTY